MDIRWLLILTVLLILAERILYRRMALAGVRYSREFSKSIVEAGAEVHLVEVIENRKWLPVPWVVLESTFDRAFAFQSKTDLNVRQTERYQNHRSYFAMAPFTRITRRHNVRCWQRGVYRMDTAAMTCGDIFGIQVMAQAWNLTGSKTELVVLPQVKPIDEVLTHAQSWQGDTVVRRWILPDPFIRAGSRPYQAGDTLSQVNWMATARTGSLQVHQQEHTADFRVQVILNFEVIENMWDRVTEPERVEAGIAMAASFVAHYVERGVPVGFCCNGTNTDGSSCERFAPNTGSQHLQDVLLAMARLGMQVDMNITDLVQDECDAHEAQTDYVIITGFVHPPLEDVMESLRARGNAVAVVPLPKGSEVETWLSVGHQQSELTSHAG